MRLYPSVKTSRTAYRHVLSMKNHKEVYPVFCLARPPLQAFLEPFPDAPLEELLHQFAGVFQLLFANDRLQSRQVPLTRLLQGGHGKLGHTLLVHQRSLRDPCCQSDRATRLHHAGPELQEMISMSSRSTMPSVITRAKYYEGRFAF